MKNSHERQKQDHGVKKTIGNCYHFLIYFCCLDIRPKTFLNQCIERSKVIMAQSVEFVPKCWTYVRMGDFQSEMSGQRQMEMGFF